MRFTDSYGEQSCTAGRVVVHHRAERLPHRHEQGRHPGRRRSACSPRTPTIAELLKPLGYATGQFGKNHLGDLNKFLPTVHGFDEFFGNLYHLNAEEEPESPNYPPPEDFPQLHGNASAARRPALVGDRGGRHRAAPMADRSGSSGSRTPGPLTKKRMETIDDESAGARHRLHPPPARGGDAVLRVDEHHAHALPDPHRSRRASARPVAGSRRTTTR